MDLKKKKQQPILNDVTRRTSGNIRLQYNKIIINEKQTEARLLFH